jgi:uncharacterized protein YjiS (DUF1127 family)
MDIILERKWVNLTSVKAWFVRLFVKIIEARQADVNRKIALMQLSSMSDRELRDIGLHRGDIRRVVYEAY